MISEDGTLFSLARSTNEETLQELTHLLFELKDVTDLVLQQIDLTHNIFMLLEQLLRSEDRASPWRTWKFVDCRFLEQDTNLTSLTGQFCVPRLMLQTTPNFPNNSINFMPLTELLSNSPSLTTLRLCHHDLTEETAICLADGLQQTKVLQGLSLSGTRRCALQVETLARGLRNNASLLTLDLGDCKLNDQALSDLIMALKSHPTLETLDLSNNAIGSQGLQSLAALLLQSGLKYLDLSLQRRRIDTSLLAPAIAKNKTLTHLYLSNTCLIDTDIVNLVDVLVQNKTLLNLNLSDNRQVTDSALLYLASRLPNIQLRYLNLRKLQNRGSECVMEAFMKGMQNNTELQLLRIHYWRHVQFTRQILFCANSNRAGRRILKQMSSVPLGLWPLILERLQRIPYFAPLPQNCKVDYVYYFFRNTPDLWERQS